MLHGLHGLLGLKLFLLTNDGWSLIKMWVGVVVVVVVVVVVEFLH